MYRYNVLPGLLKYVDLYMYSNPHGESMLTYMGTLSYLVKVCLCITVAAYCYIVLLSSTCIGIRTHLDILIIVVI